MDEYTKKALANYVAKSKIVPEYEQYGIETDQNVRWESGTDHHPKSEELMRHIAELDFCFMGDYFCWKTGGDGDNGEFLMYLMDMFFELQDAKNEKMG